MTVRYVVEKAKGHVNAKVLDTHFDKSRVVCECYDDGTAEEIAGMLNRETTCSGTPNSALMEAWAEHYDRTGAPFITAITFDGGGSWYPVGYVLREIARAEREASE